jgi:hypothetical protein
MAGYKICEYFSYHLLTLKYSSCLMSQTRMYQFKANVDAQIVIRETKMKTQPFANRTKTCLTIYKRK